MSTLGLICAVAGLALLAIFGAPVEDAGDRASTDGQGIRAGRVVEQLAAVSGVGLLGAAAIFHAQLW
jgi:predicted benzoate:H+ symporter BenE